MAALLLLLCCLCLLPLGRRWCWQVLLKLLLWVGTACSRRTAARLCWGCACMVPVARRHRNSDMCCGQRTACCTALTAQSEHDSAIILQPRSSSCPSWALTSLRAMLGVPVAVPSTATRLRKWRSQRRFCMHMYQRLCTHADSQACMHHAPGDGSMQGTISCHPRQALRAESTAQHATTMQHAFISNKAHTSCIMGLIMPVRGADQPKSHDHKQCTNQQQPQAGPKR